MRIHFLIAVLLVASTSFSHAREFVVAGDIQFRIGTSWKVEQTALSGGTWIVGISKNDVYLQIFAREGDSFDLREFAVNSADIEQAESNAVYGPLKWTVLSTSKAAVDYPGKIHVRAFQTAFRDKIYYGYSRAKTLEKAQAAVEEILENVVIPLNGRSLTGPEYNGKKYYLGWGAAGAGDPGNMHNEVKYDVLHTHDIFTKNIGGDYIGTKLVGSGTATASAVRKEWQNIKGLMTANDMYVQYSSGHGSPSGLGIGLKYTEIADTVLAYPGKELIVFIMACHSGGLVNTFNNKKSVWEKWNEQGRTLFVMASSTVQQSSSTGPGKDKDEPNGPSGSAGSAFGHALWKALIGYADGHVDGVKDGFLSLGEIRDFSVMKTKQVGKHTPVHTGVYNAQLIMNKKPSREFVESLEHTTEGLSDDEVMKRIQDLDRAMSIR